MRYVFASVLSTSTLAKGHSGGHIASGYERNAILLYSSGFILLSGITQLSSALLMSTEDEKIDNTMDNMSGLLVSLSPVASAGKLSFT